MEAGGLLVWWGVGYLASTSCSSSWVSRASVWESQTGLLGPSFNCHVKIYVYPNVCCR